MADAIGINVTGDQEVGLKFDTFPKRAHDALLTKITSLTGRLAAKIRAKAPKGKTGKLANSIVEQIYDDVPKKITGRVTVDESFAKAGALEWGAHGKAKVKAHSQKLDHNWAHKLSAPRTVMVQAYTRQTNILARKFERSSLADMSGEITQQLHDTVDKVAEETS